MERVKKEEIKVQVTPEDDGRIWWRKVNGDSSILNINGRDKYVKLNERFKARADEIPAAFRDQIVPLQDIPAPVVEKPVQGKIPVYSLRPIVQESGMEGEEMFDIVNEQGKKINDIGLSKEVAYQLLNDLQK